VNEDEHSLFMTLRIGLFLRIICGRKGLNPFFRLHEASEVLSFSPGLSLVAFMRRYGVKIRLACTVAKAADIQWSKMLTVCNTARVKLGVV